MVDWFIKELCFEVRVCFRRKSAASSNVVEELELMIKNFCDVNDGIELHNFKHEQTPYVEIRDE